MTLPPPLLPHHRMPAAPLPPAGSIRRFVFWPQLLFENVSRSWRYSSSRGGLFAQRACVVCAQLGARSVLYAGLSGSDCTEEQVRSLADRLNQSPAISVPPEPLLLLPTVSEPTVTMATASTTTQPHPRNRSTHPTRRLGRLATGQLSRRLWSGCGCLLKPLLTRRPTRGKRPRRRGLPERPCSPSPCRSCPTCRRVRSIRLVDKRTISRSAGWSELFEAFE
uniref:Uncharacterized protein n=1 Tax=Macrostomum lignano TaxID=282301 RepID=A0A1I8FH71_9PLAT